MIMDEHLLLNPGKAVIKSLRRRQSATIESGTYETDTNESNKCNKPHRLSATVRFSGHLNPTPELTTYGGIKLGWIQGVLIPCLLNIWGVMLFLRISWVVGQAGILGTIIIISISGIVCVITTLSLSAICTNGELKGGGVYYLVSRSLGAEFGASVGIIFAFANAVAASMNTIGFCDSLNELLKLHGLKILDNDIGDTRIVGTIALFVMCVICAIGMDWETKTQNFLVIIIVLAILNFIIGAGMGPKNNEAIARGFVGMSKEIAQQNWMPDYRDSDGINNNFFSIFAMFFPAMTGVQAGANICGDLRDPATAIPKGTLLALAISITSYLVMALMSGMGVLRDASGDTSDLTHSVLQSCKPDCEYGLLNNYDVMQLMALWGPLIYGGCWAATLSTALTNLLSVPRLIQALGVDRIYPGLIFFSKPYGKHGEPYRGYALTFFVSFLFLLIADLNTIAPLISNFYLASYALINFCTFHTSLVKQISWRPTFRYYNKWLSLMGFIMCAAIMMVISWVMALITTILFMTLYLLVLYTKPEASWGSSTDAQRYQETIVNILQISRQARHIKSYNPQVLVLAGTPFTRPVLLDVANLITHMGSFMIVADVHHKNLSGEEKHKRIQLGEDWLQSGKLRAFYVLLSGFRLPEGVRALAQSSGLGRFRPNIVLLGYLHHWTNCNKDRIGNYVRTIQNAFDEKLAVMVFRISSITSKHHIFHAVKLSPVASSRNMIDQTDVMLKNLMYSDSDMDLDVSEEAKRSENTSMSVQSSLGSENQSISSSRSRHKDLDETLPKQYSIYKQVLHIGTRKSLDVWWLFNDGGLNILLPYIIARRSIKKIPLRIFALVTNAGDDDARNQMMTLLAKYRISYTDLVIIKGIETSPSGTTWKLFESFVTKRNAGTADFIRPAEISALNLKISRYLRLHEIMKKHSSEASLVVMSLPKPHKNVSCGLYMAWLEVLSNDMPPMLFIRGNNTVVLDA